MRVTERLLQCVELAGSGRQAFDGAHFVPGGLRREHQTGAHRVAIEQHGAGAAHPVLAAHMGAGKPERMA